MQTAFEVLIVDEMEASEIDAFAAEAQRVAKKISSYEQKRKMVRDGKTNRGFVQDKTHVDLDGRISFSGAQLQKQLHTVKARSKCFACGEVGHWAGDAACSKGGKSKGRGKSQAGRKGGGFLRRAGLAAVTMLSGASEGEGLMQQLTTVCNISGILHTQLQDMVKLCDENASFYHDRMPFDTEWNGHTWPVVAWTPDETAPTMSRPPPTHSTYHRDGTINDTTTEPVALVAGFLDLPPPVHTPFLYDTTRPPPTHSTYHRDGTTNDITTEPAALVAGFLDLTPPVHNAFFYDTTNPQVEGINVPPPPYHQGPGILYGGPVLCGRTGNPRVPASNFIRGTRGSFLSAPADCKPSPADSVCNQPGNLREAKTTSVYSSRPGP
jgi:hypothetical protein